MNSKRIFAFLIDYLITALIMNFPFWFLIMIPLITRNAPPVNSIIVRALISTLIAFLYLILRDIPSKCSIGKRILKLTVIDSSTKKNAQVYQKFIRNLTWLLGPIEILCFIIMGKRIGDMIAKTEVTLA